MRTDTQTDRLTNKQTNKHVVIAIFAPISKEAHNTAKYLLHV